MQIIKVLLTATISVVALFVITKIMGHKQVAQLDFFDYVSGITIGSIGAELATELETPARPLIALGVYGVMSIVLNFMTHKFPKSRKYINGAPAILMSGGKLYRRNLKKAKLDLSEFMLLCREDGYFDLEEIEMAVFEHNGKLSILPKAAYRPATPGDLKIPVDQASIGTEVVMDGRIIGENLHRMNKDEAWLQERLKALGHDRIKEILLAVYRQKDDRFTVYKTD